MIFSIWLAIAIAGIVGVYLWKQYQNAQVLVDQMIQSGELLDRLDAETLLILGVGAKDVGNYDEALNAFGRGDELGSEEATQELGLLLERLGSPDEAREACERNLS